MNEKDPEKMRLYRNIFYLAAVIVTVVCAVRGLVGFPEHFTAFSVVFFVAALLQIITMVERFRTQDARSQSYIADIIHILFTAALVAVGVVILIAYR